MSSLRWYPSQETLNLEVEFCDHCDRDTPHDVVEGGHERDSSNDSRTCHVCGWTWYGMTGKYVDPLEKLR